MRYVLFSSFFGLALSFLAACNNAGVRSGGTPGVEQYGAHGTFEPTANYSDDDMKTPFYKRAK